MMGGKRIEMMKGNVSACNVRGIKPKKVKTEWDGMAAIINFWAAVGLMFLTLLWVCGLQLATVLKHQYVVPNSSLFYDLLPPQRTYKDNGYLVIVVNGGLNQRRLEIADMVVIARYLNATLIVPLFDNGTYWNDNSTFADIYNLHHFITTLRDEVNIVKDLPPELKRREETEPHYSMVPRSFASLDYYYNRVLPQMKVHGVVHFPQAHSRLANNGLPDHIQKLRCKVNFEALKFTKNIEETGRKIVGLLRQKGPFLVLHLRYEKDILAITGCTQGLTTQEIKEITDMRYSHEGWKHTGIDAKTRRQHGGCPLTPEETTITLQALDIHPNTTIYIAAGKLYNEEKRLKQLAMAYPNLVRKENVLEPSELLPFQNHLDQMAALDYIVAIESDVFIPTFGGNMAIAVEGHRRYMGFKRTILLNRGILVKMIDDYRKGQLSWDEFALLVKKSHEHLTGEPTPRKKKPNHPLYEDFFYSNPQECLSLS